MKCSVCGLARPPFTCSSGSMAEIAAELGWSYIFDIGNGLSSVWICPADSVVVTAKVQELAAMFPNLNFTYLNFGPLLRAASKADPKATGA